MSTNKINLTFEIQIPNVKKLVFETECPSHCKVQNVFLHIIKNMFYGNFVSGLDVYADERMSEKLGVGSQVVSDGKYYVKLSQNKIQELLKLQQKTSSTQKQVKKVQQLKQNKIEKNLAKKINDPSKTLQTQNYKTISNFQNNNPQKNNQNIEKGNRNNLNNNENHNYANNNNEANNNQNIQHNDNFRSQPSNPPATQNSSCCQII